MTTEARDILRPPIVVMSPMRTDTARHNRRQQHALPFYGLLLVLGLFVPSCAQSPLGPNDTTWRVMPGHVERVSFNAFRDGRQCWVYLPPGYATSASSYPVLYLNDGAIAFDGPNAMHVNRICEDLIRRREIPPIIVVAIDQVSGSQRNFDYTPWPYQYWDEPNGGGDAYVRAVRDTLKPEIDRRYRTLGDHTNTAMAGMSLGGLVAAYAGYAYDSTFGRVAAFSPTYGYGNFGIYYFAQARGKPPLLERFYQDTGYPDDNWINYMTRLALEQGFVPGMDFMSVTVEGAGHGAKAWEHRFPDMLRFLYKR